MISSTAWVPKGYAAEYPEAYDLDDSEISRISQLAQLRLDDALEDLEDAEQNDQNEETEQNESEDSEAGDNEKFVVDEQGDNEMKDTTGSGIGSGAGNDDDLKEYDLENYDAEPTAEAGNLSIFSNIKSLSYYKSNDEDPYIVLPKGENSKDDLDDDEREELQILNTDNLLLAVSTEDELSELNVYVYEEQEGNLYIHHDILLPSFPLCVEWLDVRVGRTRTEENQNGSFVAVGTFEPDIEIWNLDVLDQAFPDAVLGNSARENQAEPAREAQDKKKKKKKKIQKIANDAYHVDAVLSLAANRQHRNLLASASADKTVKLWDINTLTCARSYSFHSDKVCSLSWHPEESTIILTGSYDRTVIATDMRAPDVSNRRWGVDSDVESVKWNSADANYFFVSTEGGRVHYFDARNAPSSPEKSKPIWTLQAHDSEVSVLEVNNYVKGLIATGSTDKQVKLWDVSGNKPSLIASRDLGVGKVFTASWLPDKHSARTLAVGGSQGVVKIWDAASNREISGYSNSQDIDEEEDDEL
ncbi:WD40-repeat-containing domain protein [Lipomyces japonicus]|uniref:WD40-repeat-containing domain protein n=1 Tax=Lipomyces japonicus TaxID=56871 RepID=UPI0034CDFA9C